MKSVIFSSLLVSAFSIKCNWQTPSYKLNKDGAFIDLNIDWPGIELPGLRECGWPLVADQWACASTKFEGSFIKTEKNWLTGNEYESSWTYESETKACTITGVCDKLAGGVDGCQSAKYTYEKWIPQTCNKDEDFNAITEDFETTLTLSCCSADYCNANEDYNNCNEVSTFSTYISALNQCWNDYKRTFMTELLCDNDGLPNRDILSFGQNCTQQDGSWSVSKRSDTKCKYRPTCAAEMRDTLIEFGECACKAAKDSGYTGDFIGTAMQNNWQRFCPNIQLSCAVDSGIVELIYKYFVVKYKFVVSLAKDLIDEDKLEALKKKIAELLNIDEITITIEIDVSVDAPRRLLQDETQVLVKVQADDEYTKEFIETNMNSDLANDLTGTAGANVTMTSVDSTEGSEAKTGTFESFTTTGKFESFTTTGKFESGTELNVSIVSLITVFVCVVVAAMFN